MNDFVVTIDEKKYSINMNHSENILMDDKTHQIEIIQLSDHTFKLELDGNIYHITTNKLDSNRYSFLVNGHYFESNVRTLLEEKAINLLSEKDDTDKIMKIKSPMPGLILRIDKKVGEKVDEGEPLILLEAMKMENEIRSPSAGIISEIIVEEGISVEKNQSLIIVSKP